MRLKVLAVLATTACLVTGSMAVTGASAKKAPPPPPPPAPATPPDVIVTMIDTGVRATHQEFDYQGPASTTDQFVAWWDFSNGTRPAAGQTWDTTTPDPYDNNGHGTATASAAVGRNVVPSPTKTPSFAPGFKLAVAKVTGNSVTNTDDGSPQLAGVVAAFQWARETVHTDVISMSIGSIIPAPAAGTIKAVYDQIQLAREAGILVVVANGNGWGNTGYVPGEPGWATAYGNSPYALGVGAADVPPLKADGAMHTWDPEVTSAAKINLAAIDCDTCYFGFGGTSFSAPRVAGFAAHLKQTALAAGAITHPDYLETLVKYSARDTVDPPAFEGYGVIGATEQADAEAHAAAGTLPSRPSPDTNALYVENVQGTLDKLWVDNTAIVNLSGA
jgi:hypothetical protein